jgi:hypothetical protein
MPEDVLLQVQITLARMDERLAVLRNIDMKCDALDAKMDAMPTFKDLAEFDRRIGSLERSRAWVVSAAMAGVSAASAGLYWIGKKLGV